jgi:hypothetical protein
MSDPFDSPEDDPADARAGARPDDPLPWDSDPPEEDGARHRHDAFTARRKHEYLKALVKTGCIEDACRIVGVSSNTVYRHQGQDETFFHHCALALRMREMPVELTAWQRGVEGVEERFVAGGKVHVRTRYSDNLLRLLLQGANPRKYGPRPGFKRKRILKHERKQMEREIRAEIAASQESYTFDESIRLLEKQLQSLEATEAPKKFAQGWTKSPDGHWIPPGYAPIPGWIAPEGQGDGGLGGFDGQGTPLDSM